MVVIWWSPNRVIDCSCGIFLFIRWWFTRVIVHQVMTHQGDCSSVDDSPGWLFIRWWLTRVIVHQVMTHQGECSSGGCSSGDYLPRWLFIRWYSARVIFRQVISSLVGCSLAMWYLINVVCWFISPSPPPLCFWKCIIVCVCVCVCVCVYRVICQVLF